MEEIVNQLNQLYKIPNPTKEELLKILELDTKLSIELKKEKLYTIEEIINIINDEGFDYAFAEYISPNKLDNPLKTLVIDYCKTKQAIKKHLTTISPNWCEF